MTVDIDTMRLRMKRLSPTEARSGDWLMLVDQLINETEWLRTLELEIKSTPAGVKVYQSAVKDLPERPASL